MHHRRSWMVIIGIGMLFVVVATWSKGVFISGSSVAFALGNAGDIQILLNREGDHAYLPGGAQVSILCVGGSAPLIFGDNGTFDLDPSTGPIEFDPRNPALAAQFTATGCQAPNVSLTATASLADGSYESFGTTIDHFTYNPVVLNTITIDNIPFPLKATVTDGVNAAAITDATLAYRGQSSAYRSSNVFYWAIANGSGTLSVSKAGYVTSTATVTTNGATGQVAQAVALAPTLQVTVVDAAGAPVTDATLSYRSLSSSASSSNHFYWTLVDGSGTLSVAKTGYATSTSTVVTSSQSQTVAAVTLNPSLQVTVIDQAGNALAGVTATYRSLAPTSTATNVLSWVIADGTGNLVISKDGYTTATTAVTTASASGQTTATVTLSQQGRSSSQTAAIVAHIAASSAAQSQTASSQGVSSTTTSGQPTDVTQAPALPPEHHTVLPDSLIAAPDSSSAAPKILFPRGINVKELEYAIVVEQTGQPDRYLQADGTLDSNPEWRPWYKWGFAHCLVYDPKAPMPACLTRDPFSRVLFLADTVDKGTYGIATMFRSDPQATPSQPSLPLTVTYDPQTP